MSTLPIRRQTITLPHPPAVAAFANIGGRHEAQGPLAGYFDRLCNDSRFGQPTWEKAESAMQQQVLHLAMDRAGLAEKDLDLVLGGDLLNQCIATSFCMRDAAVPFYGLYGACSTMGEALSLAALLVSGGFLTHAAALASSHFCAVERQYRMPMPYGSQRAPTAQWTATAAGCTILRPQGPGPRITHVTCGRVVDKGVTDPANMGAAMAPAACDTLTAFFRDTGMVPDDFDLIVTGDLGALGHRLLQDLLARNGLFPGDRLQDCGLLLYDLEKQDMHAGGSGAGCSAAVLSGYLLRGLRDGRWRRLLFAPTGALLSPTSSMQGESIPGICHALCLSAQG